MEEKRQIKPAGEKNELLVMRNFSEYVYSLVSHAQESKTKNSKNVITTRIQFEEIVSVRNGVFTYTETLNKAREGCSAWVVLFEDDHPEGLLVAFKKELPVLEPLEQKNSEWGIINTKEAIFIQMMLTYTRNNSTRENWQIPKLVAYGQVCEIPFAINKNPKLKGSEWIPIGSEIKDPRAHLTTKSKATAARDREVEKRVERLANSFASMGEDLSTHGLVLEFKYPQQTLACDREANVLLVKSFEGVKFKSIFSKAK